MGLTSFNRARRIDAEKQAETVKAVEQSEEKAKAKAEPKKQAETVKAKS